MARMKMTKPHKPGSRCPTCAAAAKLPWSRIDDLAGVTSDVVHDLVRKIKKYHRTKVGVVLVLYTEHEHALTVSNVPSQWLAELGRQLIAHASRREGGPGHSSPALPTDPKGLN